MGRSLIAALALACAGGCASDATEHRPLLLDTEQKPAAESALALPPFPAQKDLIEFPVHSAPHRYFIDPRSVSVGADGIVRYTVVVNAAGGAVNTHYEGIRCATWQKRLYAVGRDSGKWVEAKQSAWTEIRRSAPGEYQASLHRDYFCDGRATVRNAEEAVRSLRASARGRVDTE